MQKSQAFLHTNNKLKESQIKNELPFTIATKSIKIPRNKTNKECKGPLQGGLQTTAKEIREVTNRWRNIPCSWLEKNQYRENGHTAQSNLQTQRYPHQATSDLLHRTGEPP